MAGEFETNLGTEALRRNVAAVRANAGANNPVTPPDPFVPPWLQGPGPTPVVPPVVPLPPRPDATPPPVRNGPTPVVAAAPKPKSRPRRVAKIDGKEVEEPPTPQKKLDTAWKIAQKICRTYADELGKGVSIADLHLSQALMKNGTLLLRYGLPMDNLGQMIRLARDLAHNADKEGGTENEEIDELRKILERSENSLPPLQAHNEPPDDEEDDDNGE